MSHPTETTTRTLALLTGDPTSGEASDAQGGGCGCGGCGCGAVKTDVTSNENTVKENDVATSTFAQSYPVTGMTCGHCVASVTEELEELAGVREVKVALVAGGTSTVTVTSDQPLERDAVQAAVVEAGYQLA